MKPQLNLKPLLLVTLVVGFVGCTNQDVYNVIQGNQQFECKNLPPAQYEDCINAPAKTFNEYEAERNEVITP